MWPHLAFTALLISGIYLLYHNSKFTKALNLLSPIGRMSLSNYVMQSVLGSCIYYGFGLGLFQYTGATYSLLIGLTLALMLGTFCYYWFLKYRQGPLEIIWHKLTWLGTEKKSTKHSKTGAEAVAAVITAKQEKR